MDGKYNAANAALIVAGIVLALLVGELFLRFTPLGGKYFYVYDPHVGWRLKPSAHGWQIGEGEVYLRINRWGYRGPDWTLHKSPRTFRIAVLGDSFTEAEQLPEEKTFCSVVERQLTSCPVFHAAQRCFDRVEVLNFGCDSYGTAQELITLQRQVWQFAPDMVVLAVFTGNDIRNNSVVLENTNRCRPFYLLRNDGLALGGPFEDSWWFRMGCRVRFTRNIEVLNVATRARDAIRNWMQSRRAQVAGTTATPSLAEPGLDNFVYLPPKNEAWSRAWDITERLIIEIYRECRQRQVVFLAVAVANPAQDNPDADARAKYEKWLGVDNLNYPDRRIQQLGEREGFEVLNLAEPMREYAESHHVLLHGFKNTPPGSGHWNSLGHQVAGGLIASHICGLLSAPSSQTKISGCSATFTDHDHP